MLPNSSILSGEYHYNYFYVVRFPNKRDNAFLYVDLK